MRLIWICLLPFLFSCTAPIYENTTYGLEDFALDSNQISQGMPGSCCEEADFSALSNAYEEIIVEGDQLSIALYSPQRKDRMQSLAVINETIGFPVCQGKICLPQLCTIEVEGLTLKEAQKKIEDAYLNELSDIQVFLNFKKKRERQVQIIGAAIPMITVDGRMRLSEVLSIATIHPYANLVKSYVMRQGQKLPINLYRLIHEGDEKQNIIMQGGDQIFIAHVYDASVMLTGEVRRPLVIPAPYGFLSLREAIVLAGGIPFTGDKRCIQIIRGELARPKVYSLTWKEITHTPNQSLLLMPGDVVVISEKPITQWNRFINQVAPCAGAIQGTYNVFSIYKDLESK